MPVRIRLTRKGTHKSPYYRIVIVDSRKSRGSSYLDCVGTYNPLTEDSAKVVLDKEKVNAWLQKGAQPSDTVKQFIANYK